MGLRCVKFFFSKPIEAQDDDDLNGGIEEKPEEIGVLEAMLLQLEEDEPDEQDLKEIELLYSAAKQLDPDLPRFKEGDLVVAIFNYKAHSDEELSFKKYNRFKIVSVDDPEWILVEPRSSEEKYDTTGYVPANYVVPSTSLEIFDWYYGPISRRETEINLFGAVIGTFLIRDSYTNIGDFSLSLKVDPNKWKMPVRHFQIVHKDEKFSFWGVDYSTLHEFVEKHRGDAHGLPSALVDPLPKPSPEMKDLSIKTKKDWSISHKEIQLYRELPSGNYSRSFWGKWYGIEEVAVKTYSKGNMTDEEFQKEVTIIKDFYHPNIVNLYAVCCSDPIYLVMPYMENGSLYQLLILCKDKCPFDSDRMADTSFQISKGMEYLESKNYVHRNLTLRNILIDSSFTCKISDIGHAKILEMCTDKDVLMTKTPVRWSAPEVFQKCVFSIKSDVWAFAVVVIEVFTGGEPVYTGMHAEKVKEEVLNGYRLPKPILCPAKVYDSLVKCWDFNPEERPSFEELRITLDEAFD